MLLTTVDIATKLLGRRHRILPEHNDRRLVENRCYKRSRYIVLQNRLRRRSMIPIIGSLQLLFVVLAKNRISPIYNLHNYAYLK
ncbi:hypothetical protein BCR39DRAFT_535105 [Naematelia encephala]|uniref:Uncharacterized protein n=1 Tax=Naematelia encephala TaxID=71784 RepID=A0A1Y2B1A9_9TREE|nr:hypothetical protein BCR39DRAFT_535105 [Naematelia encephala]